MGVPFSRWSRVCCASDLPEPFGDRAALYGSGSLQRCGWEGEPSCSMYSCSTLSAVAGVGGNVAAPISNLAAVRKHPSSALVAAASCRCSLVCSCSGPPWRAAWAMLWAARASEMRDAKPHVSAVSSLWLILARMLWLIGDVSSLRTRKGKSFASVLQALMVRSGSFGLAESTLMLCWRMSSLALAYLRPHGVDGWGLGEIKGQAHPINFPLGPVGGGA